MDAMNQTPTSSASHPDPTRFDARVRLSIDGRVFPEVVAYLQSIPARKVNKTLEMLLVRAIITSPPEGVISSLAVPPSGAQSRPPASAVQPHSMSASRVRRPRPASSPTHEEADRQPAPPASALASGDLSAFGSFDASTFEYGARGDGA